MSSVVPDSHAMGWLVGCAVRLRMVMFPAFLATLLLSAQPCAAGVPEHLLRSLAADAFKDRESAERELARWALENRDVAYDELHRHARTHPVAEVRVRCLSVLRNLVLDLYAAEGEGYVGIQMMEDSVRLPGREEATAALVVNSVMPGSPAEKGGLQMGDYIVALNEEPWKTMPVSEDFRGRVKAMKPRSEARLKVLRGAELLEIRVNLARRPAAIRDTFPMPSQAEIDAVEEERREDYFKKWLLERRNVR